MSAHDLVSVGIGLLNLAVAVVLVVHIRCLGIRPPMPLVVLALIFAIRAAARLVPPIGEDPDGLDLALDVALFLVLAMLVTTTRRLVTTFAHERDALQRARVDYDDALFRHEADVVESIKGEFDRMQDALDGVANADSEAARQDALDGARASLAAMRANARD